jgi:hypothetical protein
MTAHPKYISYLGTIAPQDKKAPYMGFGFLYGVFGSFIGGILGAFLYVRLIDNPMLNFIKMKAVETGNSIAANANITDAIEQAQKFGISKESILTQANTNEFWYVFTGIGVLAIISLYLYEKFIGTKHH